MGQFGEFEERPTACAVCEAMLPEAVDGMLSEAEQAAFDKHVAGCMECARELAEARRGAAWLSMLKSQAPEPPADLLARILAETTGAESTAAASATQPAIARPTSALAVPPTLSLPRASETAWMKIRRQLDRAFPAGSMSAVFQPRLAMTAAMAFFSIALTLNLTGVRLRDVRASNFTPSALKRTMGDIDASATRMFQNNRAVYQVESRLSELRNDDSMNNPAGHR